MKKTLSMILAALMVAGAAATTVVASDEEVNLTEIATYSVSGDVTEGSVEDAFDGDITTGVNLGANNTDNALILTLEQPAFVTYFTFSGWDRDNDGIIDTPWNIHGTSLYGSNDGETWEFIMQFGDPYWEYDEYAYDLEVACTTTYATEYAFDGEEDEDADMMEPVAFQYFKVCTDERGWPEWGDVEVWGTLVEVEPDYITGDLDASGAVDIEDAILLFNHSMLEDLYPIDYAGDIDFDASGEVDIEDAILLFNHSVLPDLYPLG